MEQPKNIMSLSTTYAGKDMI